MTEKQRQDLFNFFYNEHGIQLLISDLDEITNILKVEKCRFNCQGSKSELEQFCGCYNEHQMMFNEPTPRGE